jgi:lipoprotein-anchoring transpeptidase ErfK/SrfK
MSAARLFFFGSLALLAMVFGLGVAKKIKQRALVKSNHEKIELKEIQAESWPNPLAITEKIIIPQEKEISVMSSSNEKGTPTKVSENLHSHVDHHQLSKDLIDRTPQLFNPFGPRLPIVQTIRYTPKVQWVKDRPAWIVDYASHYQTSKHFISRSLTGKKDYFHSEINPGDRFNVLKNDLNFEFYLLVDVSSCKMRFYYLEPAKKELVLLKTYSVVVGRRDVMSPSSCLTPLGKYRLGPRIAVYKAGMIGTFRKQKAEMIQVFGTRWIPFEEEIAGCTAPAKGYGIHGQPWIKNPEGQWIDNLELANGYHSDGCIRMKTEDMEEVFSIIVTRPTTIEIVKSFEQATLDAKDVEPTIVMNP